MCGIHVVVSTTTTTSGDEVPQHLDACWLSRRGPDHQATTVVHGVAAAAPNNKNGDDSTRIVVVQASVLSMRSSLVPQPVQVAANMYLCWNGEIYQDRNDDHHASDDAAAMMASDTAWIANAIRQCNDHHHPPFAQQLGHMLQRLHHAEFAVTIVTPAQVWYARDGLGRRSLLVCGPSTAALSWELASVASTTTTMNDNERQSHKKVWTEVPPGNLFCYNIGSQTTTEVAFFAPTTITDLPKSPPPPAASSVLCEQQHHVITLQHLLQTAVQRRLVGWQHVGVAVLFSGGLDSVVLATLALHVVDEISLINVGFVDNDHQPPPPPDDDDDDDDDDDQQFCPALAAAADTVAAQAAYRELQQLHPHAVIHFVQRTVTWSQVASHQQHIEQLICPQSSIMDRNIGTALWFAATAATAPTTSSMAQQRPRILLSGLGADEYMGGYGRHRQAFDRGGGGGGGWAALRDELTLDQGRLWERNLGRDDRVLSDAGVEPRYPYLDHDVVRFVRSLPLPLVVDYSLPPGHGDKRILRQVAARLGLTTASHAIKRAIQFGSRLSQVADKHRYGSRRQANRRSARSHG